MFHDFNEKTLKERKMPTPTENLWNACRKLQINEVISLINTNPELVNAVNEDDRTVLKHFLLGNIKHTDLFKTIVLHPQFNLHHTDEEEIQTNLDVIIILDRLDVLEMVIKNPKVITNPEKLTYECIKDELATEDSDSRIEILKKMLSLIRDATILHALKTDDAGLLTKLQIIGAEPTKPLGKLGGERSLEQLILPTNKNVKSWFNEHTEKQSKKISNNPNMFHKHANDIKDIEKQLKDLELKEAEEKAALIRKAVKEKGERIDQFVNNTNKK